MELSGQILYAALVLGLLAAVLAAMKRFNVVRWTNASRSQTPRMMELLERVSLTPHHSVHLIRIDGRLLFVGVSPSGCHLLESSAAPSQDGKAVSA
jgi:flagellar biogenesis protein FliO